MWNRPCNRTFSTKAVRIWRLIPAYFKHAGGFGEVSMEDRSIDTNTGSDPLFAVWARKAEGG